MKILVCATAAALILFPRTAGAQRYQDMIKPSPERSDEIDAEYRCSAVIEQRIADFKKDRIPLMLFGRVVSEEKYRQAALLNCLQVQLAPSIPLPITNRS
jgi:hypothetical protein